MTGALPRAVTFDCWSTLLVERDWPTAHALRVASLRDAAREAGRSIDLDTGILHFDLAWERHMALWRTGVATGAREVADFALESLGLEVSRAVRGHLVTHFEEASHSGRVEPLDGARRTLVALREHGIRLGLVCDTGLTPGRVVRRHLDLHGLLEPLEGLAFSDEVGVPKPHPKAFAAALAPLACAPEDAVHVGDLKAMDVAGARGLGMRTIRIHAEHDDTSRLPDADAVVASHEALLEQLLSGAVIGR